MHIVVLFTLQHEGYKTAVCPTERTRIKPAFTCYSTRNSQWHWHQITASWLLKQNFIKSKTSDSIMGIVDFFVPYWICQFTTWHLEMLVCGSRSQGRSVEAYTVLFREMEALVLQCCPLGDILSTNAAPGASIYIVMHACTYMLKHAFFFASLFVYWFFFYFYLIK